MIMTPWHYINLVGTGHFRAQTIPMKSEVVKSMLPWGMELGPQELTEPGYHPVTLFFQEMVRAHMSVPSPLPNMTYHEQILGFPFVYVTQGYPGMGALGPFYYMPNLFLSEWLPTLGGLLFWGLNKQLAEIEVDERTWTVLGNSSGGPGGERRKVIQFEREPYGEWLPASAYPHFENFSRPVDGIMVQPLVSMLPAGYQLISICSNFDKKWDEGMVRPLRSKIEISQSFVPNLPCGTFPSEGWSEGIDASPTGAFELLAPWRLSLPYPCSMANTWPSTT